MPWNAKRPFVFFIFLCPKALRRSLHNFSHSRAWGSYRSHGHGVRTGHKAQCKATKTRSPKDAHTCAMRPCSFTRMRACSLKRHFQKWPKCILYAFSFRPLQTFFVRKSLHATGHKINFPQKGKKRLDFLR